MSCVYVGLLRYKHSGPFVKRGARRRSAKDCYVNLEFGLRLPVQIAEVAYPGKLCAHSPSSAMLEVSFCSGHSSKRSETRALRSQAWPKMMSWDPRHCLCEHEGPWGYIFEVERGALAVGLFSHALVLTRSVSLLSLGVFGEARGESNTLLHCTCLRPKASRT